MEQYMYVLVGLALVLGGLVGYFVRQIVANQQIRSTQKEAQRLLDEASAKHKEMLLEAKHEATRVRNAAETESREYRLQLQHLGKRLDRKEETLERKLSSIEQRERDLDGKKKEIGRTKAELEEVKREQLARLESLSGISSGEAKRFLLQGLEQEVKEEASRQVRAWEAQIKAVSYTHLTLPTKV